MSRAFQIYEAICAVCEAINGLGEHQLVSGENEITKELGIPNFDKAYNTYYNYLYSLYNLSKKEGVLNDVLDLMASSECLDFKDVCEEEDEEDKALAHEDLVYSVEVGDKVRLYNGNIRYVVSIDGRDLWVSTKPGGPEGWYADLFDIEEIIEKGNEEF